MGRRSTTGDGNERAAAAWRRAACAAAVTALALAVAAGRAGPAARAQPAPGPPPAALLQVIGQIDGPPAAMAWRGDTLLVALGRTLAAYDVAADGRAARRPAAAGATGAALEAPIVRLRVDGDRAYAVLDNGRLAIVDVADPGTPQRLAAVDVGGALSVLPLGPRLWVARAGGGIAVVDVVDPRAPRLATIVAPDIAVTQLGGRTDKVVATGVPHTTGPYEPYRITPILAYTFDPRSAAPSPLGSVAVGHHGYSSSALPWTVALRGEVAIVSLQHAQTIGFAGIAMGRAVALGVQSVDVADAARPALVAYPAGSAAPLWVDGGLAFAPAAAGAPGPDALFATVRRGPALGDGPAAVAAFDLRSPLSPTLRLAPLPARAPWLAASASAVVALDARGALQSFDRPPPPAPLARRGAHVVLDAAGVAVDAAAGWAVVAHRGRGLALHDATDVAAPRFTAEVRTPGGDDGAHAVARAAGGAVAVADGPAGVTIAAVDAGDAPGLRIAARLPAAGDARALAAVGPLAVSVGHDGVAVLDLADPIAPALWARAPSVGPSRAVALGAGVAYVVTDAGAVVAVDVRIPMSPTVRGPLPGVDDAIAVAADGPVIAVAGRDSGIRFVDATTGAGLGALGGQSGIEALALADGTLFAAGPRGLHLADAGDPAAARWLAAAALAGVDGRDGAQPQAVVAGGGRVYVAAGTAGVGIAAAAVGPAVRRAFLPVLLRGFRHTAARGVPCGPDGAVVRQPAASPDGRWVVCTDGTTLYRAPADGGPSQPIELSGLAIGAVDTPVYAPDGRTVWFGCAVTRATPPAAATWELCAVDAGGGVARSWTAGRFGPGWQARRPAPSPDGRWLAFDAEAVDPGTWRVTTASDLYRLELATGVLTRLTDHPAADRFPSWFPDGRRLAFRSERDGNSELYTIDVAGGAGGLTRLTFDPAFDAYPAVAPDGRTVAFQSSRSGHDDVYLLDLASGAVRAASDGLRAYREPRFTADGRALVLRAYDLRPYADDAASIDPYRRHEVVWLPVGER